MSKLFTHHLSPRLAVAAASQPPLLTRATLEKLGRLTLLDVSHRSDEFAHKVARIVALCEQVPDVADVPEHTSDGAALAGLLDAGAAHNEPAQTIVGLAPRTLDGFIVAPASIALGNKRAGKPSSSGTDSPE
jgi:Asp-tRNA(Asn)/Glu-tRNA(Gln) amidotransferase C subunit